MPQTNDVENDTTYPCYPCGTKFMVLVTRVVLIVSVENVYNDTNTLLITRRFELVCISAVMEILYLENGVALRVVQDSANLSCRCQLDWILKPFNSPAAFCDDYDRPLVMVRLLGVTWAHRKFNAVVLPWCSTWCRLSTQFSNINNSAAPKINSAR